MLTLHCREKPVDSVLGSLCPPEAACGRVLRLWRQCMANRGRLWRLWHTVADCGDWQTVRACGRLWEMWQTVSDCKSLCQTLAACGRLWLPVADCGDGGRLWHMWLPVADCGTCGCLWQTVETAAN
jgi:hypothetical protein